MRQPLNKEKLKYVKLTKNEYESLVNSYDEELVNKKIKDMEIYIENTKKNYSNYFKALTYWLEKEKKQFKIVPQNIEREGAIYFDD